MIQLQITVELPDVNGAHRIQVSKLSREDANDLEAKMIDVLEELVSATLIEIGDLAKLDTIVKHIESKGDQ